MPIQVLPLDVANKIAAGEVVERPASVVKELIENAIDAGASTIQVDITAGGKQLIKISDDGSGIPVEEVPLAFERHATSKLTTIEDLEQVTTLGFRGEALASIASVSQMSLITRPATQTAGTEIRYEGGFQHSLRPIGAPAGTVITVENLFYNVPARLKFLKADSTEAGHVYRIVSHYALAYPEIRFALTSNGRQSFQCDGNGNLEDVLVALWDLETARQMLPVDDSSHPEMQVSGCVSTPSLHRGQRDRLIIFVNRRWVQDRGLSHAVAQAYHTFLPVGRHPLAVLNITLDPAEVDVNVHPTKAEVKFRQFNQVFSTLQRAVRAVVSDSAPLVRPAQHFGGYGNEAVWPAGPAHAGEFGLSGSNAARTEFALEAQRTLPGAFPEADDPHHLPPLRVVGQIQQMYIITEGPTGLYLIDQHAAHERIQYDRLMAQKAEEAIVSQRLLNPLLLELTPSQAALLETEWPALTSIGFELEHFGGDSYRLLAVPEMLSQTNLRDTFLGILADIAEGGLPMARETHEKVALIVCKRASIKGGQTLSPEEMRALVNQLEASDHPRTCPHGRPTMIHLSAYQLAKEFGRH